MAALSSPGISHHPSMRRIVPVVALAASVLLHVALLSGMPDWRKALPPAPPALEVRVLPPVPLAVAPAPPPEPVKRPQRTERPAPVARDTAPPPPSAPAPVLRSEAPEAPRIAAPEPPRIAAEPAPAPAQKPAPPTDATARTEAPVTPPVYNAAYLRNPAPRYPMLARRAGEQGTVTLRVRVTRDGAPASVVLERSSGSGALDHAALETVKTWRFVPAKRGEEAVEAWVLVPIVFRLEGTS